MTDSALLDRTTTTTPPASIDGERRTSVASRVAATGVGAFFVAAASSGLLSSGYDPRREAISALAALDSPQAPVMITGFLLGALGLLASAVVLWRRVPRLSGRVGAVLVGLGATCIAVAGVARQDCSDQLATCRDFGDAVHASSGYWVHQYASLLGFLLLIVSFFVLARGMRRTGRRGVAVLSRTVGAFCLVTTALLVVSPPFVTDGYGIVQRVFIATLLSWPVVAGVLLGRRR